MARDRTLLLGDPRPSVSPVDKSDNHSAGKNDTGLK